MIISMIAAIAKNNCIGKDGKLPWNIPEDTKLFREITTGHTVIMGRKTWESIPEKFRPLPNRINIVVTRQSRDYALPEGVLRADSLIEAIRKSTDSETIIIGGGEMYKQGMEFANRLYITHVDQNVDGDAFFPEIDQSIWKETSRKEHTGFTFSIYEK